jgi:hypothetical protein
MRQPDMTDVWAIGSIITVGAIGYFFGRGHPAISFSSGGLYAFYAIAAWMILVSNYHRISPSARSEARRTFILNPEHAKILEGLRVEALPVRLLSGYPYYKTTIRILDGDDEIWRGEPAEFDDCVRSMDEANKP